MRQFTLKSVLVATLTIAFSVSANAGDYGYSSSYYDNYNNSHYKKRTYKKKYYPKKVYKKNYEKKKNYAKKVNKVDEKQPIVSNEVPSKTIVAANSKSSNFLTDKKDMTLYIFDKDKGGVSNCYQDCATSWPPYLVKNNDTVKEGFTIIERKDGARQWAYKGQPLYYWAGDQKPGDKTGDGVGGVWHIIKL